MRTIRKVNKVTKHHRRVGRPPKKTLQTQETVDESSCANSPHEESLEERAPVKKALRVDPRQISNLPEEERARIREENPEMNEYFLMSARDKSKYFHTLNQNYRLLMKLPEPPGSAPKKKTIRFKKRFEIKPFSHQQTAQDIKKRKSFMELYKAKNEAKKKKLSKFPRNT